MAEVGKLNRLEVIKEVDFGLYLDGDDLGNILLPRRYLPKDYAVGQAIDVFVYLNSSDLLIATTETPKVMVGQCAYLKVVQVNPVGAFLDWGLSKDLLVPYSEQNRPMEAGKFYTIFVFIDLETHRIAASSKLNKYLREKSTDFKPGQSVDLLISGKSDMGYKAIINHRYLGLIFRDDAFKPLKIGQKTVGYIKDIRADGKIDLSLQPRGKTARDNLLDSIIADLKAQGGSSTLTDKSPPDDIYKRFNVSKANYKKALATLYKQRLILIEKQKITLIE